jgi:hypothetical protein
MVKAEYWRFESPVDHTAFRTKMLTRKLAARFRARLQLNDHFVFYTQGFRWCQF